MPAIVIRGGNLLNPETGELQRETDLFISDTKIVQTLGENELRDAQIIDARGKTVLPGLIDCHVHVIASIANLGANARQSNVWTTIRAIPILRGMLHRGFTTVRDAGGADWALKQAIETGMIDGPRIFPSGKALSQTGGHADFRQRGEDLDCLCQLRAGAIGRVVDGVEAVRLAVREELQMGATQIKVMASGGVASPTDPVDQTQYSEDELRAIVAETEAANTYVMAHAYTARAIMRAARCGVRTIEHGNLVDDDAARCMRDHQVFAVPTLVTYDANVLYGPRYGISAEVVEKTHSVRAAGKKSLEIFARNGVRMGFGTDLLAEMHGMQNSEFANRADVLGNLEAIRSATSVAADIINMRGKVGTLAAGAFADVLILDGNPLHDIRVLSEGADGIEWVIKSGKVQKSPSEIMDADSIEIGVNS